MIMVFLALIVILSWLWMMATALHLDDAGHDAVSHDPAVGVHLHEETKRPPFLAHNQAAGHL
jgi:hypothetical protein